MTSPPPDSVALGTRPAAAEAPRTAFMVLGGISLAHLMNDTIQSVLLAIYPLLQANFSLSFTQIGLITLCYQLSASLLQPGVGLYTDRHPMPFSLPVGMGFTLLGLLLLSIAPGYYWLLLAAVLVGTGSAIFHPEASRVARMASGTRHGLAQSLFQVGGNAGSALGPLLAALVIIPHGQASVAWLSLAALVAMLVLWRVGRWYRAHRQAPGAGKGARARLAGGAALTRRRLFASLGVLGALILSKYFYLASLNNYFTFYLMERFGLSIPSAQLYLFLFLGAVAVGTLIGGPVGDRVGRRLVIWVSILGVTPFTLLLPHANLWGTAVLVVIIGVVLASAFSAIVVYAQELVPGRVGLISGLFFGLAFGLAGIGAALLGWLADLTSIAFVYRLCAWLPLMGVVAWWLPDMERA